ncbi:MAG: bifunctional (p)ppGpp synthetase/guanosine-3',5'-bis(diphosphate) 3'-pyrophosphohydrolase [Bacteroidetes bacterium]|nr:MAG: bifunctional (p)ppGpp synthetase/guanosine-3',5'-bis(diphosphate) 3'-pyrophosphohydrolase [Bacteroidota bacterium]
MQLNTDTEKENKEIVKAYRNVIKACKRNLDNHDRRQIRKAFEMAVDAHKTMRRKSGEPYILHPLAVAQICAEEIGLGPTSIICALLHDVVEDTDVKLEVITLNFGEKVARIIDGLTKISGVFEQQDKSIQAENFKKLLLTLSDDVRVILIKLADRLHNMRTLDSMSAKSQLKIASETQYVYAPLAHRLGLYAIKTELEDLSTKYLEPEKYNFVKNKLQETKTQRNRYIKQFIEPLIEELDEEGLKYEIKGRPKSIHSILSKMKKQDIPFEEVYDLFAIRVIIDTEYENEKSDCWKVYSIVTNNYRPNPDRLRDWVSTPKANGYESLHTTVMGPKGKWVEVQVRTRRMDEIAEKGFAAHWKYKDSSQANKQEAGLEEWLARVREILENADQNALDFLDDFKMNFFAEEIFVFTPKGELRKLPANATILDFAFDVHSQLGEKCIGGKVNNKLVPLNQILANGDQVEILTSTKQTPKDEWLNFVVTAKAKSKIRDWQKQVKLRASAMGKEILERKFTQEKVAFTSEALQDFIQYFKLPSVTELYAQIAEEKIDRTKIHVVEILQAVKQQKLDHQQEVKQQKVAKAASKGNASGASKDGVIIGDDTDLPYSFSKCCNPIPGDEIFGFITVGEGVKIHRTNCTNAISLMSNYGYRVIKAKWASQVFEKARAFTTHIKVQGIDSVGIVSIITDIISKQLRINMHAIQISSNAGMFEGNIQLEVYDTAQLEELMNKIKAASPLIKVNREDLV